MIVAFRRGGAVFVAFMAAAVVSLPALAQDAERILSFHSDVTVNPDASLLVTETIKIRSTGNQIRHGIFRDFPTKYRSGWFGSTTVGFEIVGLKRDGKPEPYHTEERSNGVRTYFGSAEAELPPGEHRYEFTYRTTRQVGFFKDHDELYWNVNGTGSDYPTDAVSAAVHLPARVSPAKLRLGGFTGPQGSKEQAFQARVDDSGACLFHATRPFAPREGLTVVVSFPKGMVLPPARGQEFNEALLHVLSRGKSFKYVPLVVAYFIIVWFLVGRDPMRGQVTVSSVPPAGMSPAAARYVWRMGFDKTAFASGLVSLASKGYVTIEERDKSYHVKQERPPDKDLPAEERAIMQKLLGSSDSITLKQSNHKRVSSALTACEQALRLGYEKTYFLTNSKYWAPGLALSVLVVLWALLTAPHDADAPVVFLSLWLSFWTLGVLALGSQVFIQWRNVVAGVTGAAGIAQAVFITVFSIPFFAAEIVVAGILIYKASIALVALVVVLGFTDVLFYHLLKAPTLLGRRAMDELEGFKRYLDGEQRDRFGPAQNAVTPETFNDYLAYAMALGVEVAWSKRLAGSLSEGGHDANWGQPSWYRGDMWRDRGASGFAPMMAASMSTAIAAASTAPGRSSGGGSSGGFSGGSSGGGGGGGGVGGW